MNTIKVLFVLIALVLTIPATADAQETQQDAVRVTSNLVTLNVIVTDKQGRLVNGLKPDQFVVYDQNVRQQIAHFSAGAGPLSIAIIFEVHPESPQQVAAVLTALNAVYSASAELRRSTNLKKALLIVSDGKDYQSNCSFDEVWYRKGYQIQAQNEYINF
jgi:hypothetical protein